jgi:hypothetical protein
MVDLFEHDKHFQELEEQKLLSLGKITTNEVETSFARQKFMISIIYIAPECQDSLKEIFINNHSLLTSLLSKTEDTFPAEIKKILPYKEGTELYALLIKWSKDWNINEDWMIENGLIAILSWYHKPELRDEWYWYNHPEKHAQAITKAIRANKRMEMDPDYPQNYNPVIHKSKKKFQEPNKDRTEKQNQLLINYGLKRTTTKKDDRHFNWLVQYQLLKMTPKQITDIIIKDEYMNIEPESIKRAIKRTSKLVGIKI